MVKSRRWVQNLQIIKATHRQITLEVGRFPAWCLDSWGSAFGRKLTPQLEGVSRQHCSDACYTGQFALVASRLSRQPLFWVGSLETACVRKVVDSRRLFARFNTMLKVVDLTVFADEFPIVEPVWNRLKKSSTPAPPRISFVDPFFENSSTLATRKLQKLILGGAGVDDFWCDFWK